MPSPPQPPADPGGSGGPGGPAGREGLEDPARAAAAPPAHPARALDIGFDLDLTLLDARPGIAATIRALSGRTGVTIDPDVVVRRLGPPLRHELSQWFPAPIVSQAVRVYRRLYPRFAYDAARPMPFAAEALAAVQRRGGRTVVITAKLERFAQVHVERMGWPVDQVVGDRFGTGKAEAISETGVAAYLGDHEADVAAARQAGVTALGVATGVSSRSALAAAGADAVFDDLAQFVAWLDGPPARSG